MITLAVMAIILSPAVAAVAIEKIRLRRLARELKATLEAMPLEDVTALLDKHGISYTIESE